MSNVRLCQDLCFWFGCCCEQKTGGCLIEYPHRVSALLLFPRRTVPSTWIRARGVRNGLTAAISVEIGGIQASCEWRRCGGQPGYFHPRRGVKDGDPINAEGRRCRA